MKRTTAVTMPLPPSALGSFPLECAVTRYLEGMFNAIMPTARRKSPPDRPPIDVPDKVDREVDSRESASGSNDVLSHELIRAGS